MKLNTKIKSIDLISSKDTIQFDNEGTFPINFGNNFIDDEVLASLDIDIEQYRVNPNIQEKDLMPDFFC